MTCAFDSSAFITLFVRHSQCPLIFNCRKPTIAIHTRSLELLHIIPTKSTDENPFVRLHDSLELTDRVIP